VHSVGLYGHLGTGSGLYFTLRAAHTHHCSVSSGKWMLFLDEIGEWPMCTERNFFGQRSRGR